MVYSQKKERNVLFFVPVKNTKKRRLSFTSLDAEVIIELFILNQLTIAYLLVPMFLSFAHLLNHLRGKMDKQHPN